MKNLWIITVFILMVSCAKDGDTNQTFIPNISNQWTSSRGTNFFFFNYTQNVNTSAFEGNEQPGTLHFTGSFTNYDINFTFDADPKNKYTGKFVKDSNPLQINVTDSKGVKLTLTKQ